MPETTSNLTKNPPADEQTEGILVEAQEALIQGHLSESIRGFSRVLKEAPSHQVALFSRGIAYFRAGQYDQAHADFNRVLADHPRKEKIHCARGNVFLAQNNHEKALEDFNRALEHNPQYATAYFSRAEVLDRIGENQLAGEDREVGMRIQKQMSQDFMETQGIVFQHHSG